MTEEISLFPPGITANRQHIHGGVIYEFKHERLGSIGRLTLFAQGSARTQLSIDVAPGDPDDPLWEERFELLGSVALTCLSPFGVSVPLSDIEEAKAAARLYRQFTQIRYRQQMWDFARGLAEEDYTRLLSTAMLSLRGAAPADALDLRQRLSLLRKFRQAQPEERPGLLDEPLSEQGMRLVLRRKPSDHSTRSGLLHCSHGQQAYRHYWLEKESLSACYIQVIGILLLSLSSVQTHLEGWGFLLLDFLVELFDRLWRE